MTRQQARALRRAGVAVVGLAALATTAACGGDGDSHEDGHGAASAPRTAANGEVFNEADVEFATQMIPHHAQAVQMTVLAQGRPLDPEVERLVTQIRDAQVPEIEAMTDWLTGWGEDVPETSLDHANAGHHAGEGHTPEGMEDMPGMMSQEEMDALAAAPDPEFQTLWLEMMIEHHEGAVEMAEAQQEAGEFAAAVRLAETIEAGQEAEIDAMERLLG